MKNIKPLLSTAALLLSPMLASATPVVYTLSTATGPFVTAETQTFVDPSTKYSFNPNELSRCGFSDGSGFGCFALGFAQLNRPAYDGLPAFSGAWFDILGADHLYPYQASGASEELYFAGAQLTQFGSFEGSFTVAGEPNGITLMIAPAPEPGTIGLMASAFGILLLVAVRRNRCDSIRSAPTTVR